MKENIDTNSIYNRKFIIELRFEHKLEFLDKKGAIVEELQKTKIFAYNHWEIGQTDITIRDSKEKGEVTRVIGMTLNRLSYTSVKIDSVEHFYNSFQKIYDAVVKVLGDLSILRIGCRIIGTYKSKSVSYDDVLASFKKSFPSQFFLDQYPSKDLLFKLVYQNGMYQIGPISEEDELYKKEFDSNYCDKKIGVGIDTDNYLTNDNGPINEKSLVKDVFKLSLSVEKDLYSKLKEF